jgi:NADH-quinone oxidoreductase subunit I/electron transport complex protein RnfC
MTTEFERGHAYVVDRGEIQLRYGQGMAAGLGVIMRHFRDAFTKKLTNPSETSGMFTVQYPEERLTLPDAFRNFPILLYDDESGQELCTSCFQCERICPPQVIHITQEKDPNTGKPVPAAAEFLIEYDACMSCGLCAEVCPFEAIKMDHEFELSTDEHGGLTIDKAGLDRPVSYYEQIAPSFWAEARDNAYKKLQNAVKRRSGLIGIAPQVAEKLKATQVIEQPSVADEGQTTKDEGSTPADDKASRLAAIRARNAAKQAETNGTTDAAPADDKAARLAAIRARNAARKTDANGVAEGAPQPTAPADDKAARLAAIRAANTAKKAAEEPRIERQEPAQAPQPADDKAARLAAIRAANAAKKVAQIEGDAHDHSPNGTNGTK